VESNIRLYGEYLLTWQKHSKLSDILNRVTRISSWAQ
jgi:hypothetical protein